MNQGINTIRYGIVARWPACGPVGEENAGAAGGRQGPGQEPGPAQGGGRGATVARGAAPRRRCGLARCALPPGADADTQGRAAAEGGGPRNVRPGRRRRAARPRRGRAIAGPTGWPARPARRAAPYSLARQHAAPMCRADRRTASGGGSGQGRGSGVRLPANRWSRNSRRRANAAAARRRPRQARPQGREATKERRRSGPPEIARSGGSHIKPIFGACLAASWSPL